MRGMIIISEIEVWRPYFEFGFIEGSNLGRVRTLDRYVSHWRGGKSLIKGHILKQWYDRYGYLYVAFKVNGKMINRKVHRIIASCFLTKPSGFEQVNHKNCIRDDNRIMNLEWCTASYNQRYREKHGVSQTEAQGHRLIAINIKTQEVSQFRSQREAGRVLNVKDQNINGVIKGRHNQSGGYWFVNADDHSVENTRNNFGDEIACKVEKLMSKNELV